MPSRGLRRIFVATLLFGCEGPHDVKSVELDPDPDEDLHPLPINSERDVDILFVIDDSSSMAAEQANLAANFAGFIEMLEAADVRANYRIGVTTTNNGHPLCSGSTTPEGGNLVLSSCTTRLDDFVAEGIDVRDLGCNDICKLDAEALEILPTTTHYDPDPAPRPWLERIDGVKNIPAGTRMADAFSCFAPQGIAGCGYEAPLESMYLALARSYASTETSHGFHRPDAALAIVLVTDEVDCSYDKDWAEIFSPEGNREFWSDPDAEWPTSAVCWNAGVKCSGDPGHYDGCHPVDLDVAGQAAGPGEAVLHPVARYRDRLQDLEDQLHWLDPNRELTLALIGGVTPEGAVHYAEAGDPEFQLEYGIGPGCTGPLGENALPPVRIRSLVEEFTPGNLHSICAPDFTAALDPIVETIRSWNPELCYAECVADREPSTAIVEPDCRVELHVRDAEPVPVPECLRSPEGSYVVDPVTSSLLMPNDEVDLCVGFRVDDDISAHCAQYGVNLQFEFAYRPDVQEPRGWFVAECVHSDEPELDCPGLEN